MKYATKKFIYETEKWNNVEYKVRKYVLDKDNLTWQEAKVLRSQDRDLQIVPMQRQ